MMVLSFAFAALFASAAGCGAAGEHVANIASVVCLGLDALPDAQMQALFESGAKKMADDGDPLDGEDFEEGDGLMKFIRDVYGVAGCDAPALEDIPKVQGMNTNYCGSGKGPTLPTVSSCLNKLCYEHDACYSMCSAHVGSACLWSAATNACDEAMLRRVDACQHEQGTQFLSEAVIFAAKRAHEVGVNNPCPGTDTKCGGEKGNGPCQAAVGSGDDDATKSCKECAARHDPGMKCFKESNCDFDDDGRLSVAETVCYNANCAEVEDCF